MEIGTTTTGVPLSLSDEQRRRHIYISGQTGTGKSTLLACMMRGDFETHRPFALLDPHGDLAVYITDSTPPSLTNDVLYLDPLDPSHIVGYNPLRHVPIGQRSQLAADILATFHARWSDSWGPRMSYILGHAIRLLLDNRTTLLSLPVLLTDDRYRVQLLRNSTDSFNRRFWEEEYARYNERFKLDAIAPIQNKAGVFTADSNLRAVIGQTGGTLNVSHLMNRRKYLVANLNKAMGDEPSGLLGSFLTTAFAHAAHERFALPEQERIDFTLYVDEFQNFATSSFASILSEARKYRLNLVLANQYLSQVPDQLRAAVFGNVSTIVAFRTGAEDAELLGKQLGLPPTTLIDTPNYHAWVRSGAPSTATILTTYPAPSPCGRFAAVQARTRARHAVSREMVEKRIAPPS